MNTLKRTSDILLVLTCILSGFILYGCGAQSLGPQEPLLPTIDADSKFSDRFQLNEEPQFFFDLFGKELLEGHEVNQYVEEKEFDRNGELIIGRTGQLDTVRYAVQLDRTILTEDAYRGRYTEFAIGDHLRIKPATLFPNRYIMFKNEFDGFRWDLSFAQERHLFTLLNSRISNPIFIGEPPDLSPTLGRRNGLNLDANVRHLENSRLIGFRGQGLLGDVFRIGFTYINLRKEHPERVENPLHGTVANTPPETITIIFRDDSPEDNHIAEITDFEGYNADLHGGNIQGGVGAAVRKVTVTIVTQELEEITQEDRDAGIEPQPLAEETQSLEIFIDEILPANPEDRIKESVDGEWKIAEGFNRMKYDLVFEDHEIEPRTVKSVVFDMIVAGDYNIAVIGVSSANQGDVNSEWIKTEDGHIQMPYRDVIQAPGNYGQSSDYTENREQLTDNPSAWEGEGKPRKVQYRYGAARAAVLYGLDLEGTVGNVFIRAHYSINGKYKQYPTIPKNRIGFSRLKETIQVEDSIIGADNDEQPTGITIDPATHLPVDANGIPTYSETEGERFEAHLGGDGTDVDGDGQLGRETAWFVQLKSRFGKLYLEGVWYHIDPGYTTTYANFGASGARDELYTLPRTPPTLDGPPWDLGIYTLIEDDDDDDDWPDDVDFDGVLPRADDRDQNGVLDFQEDFFIFEADPPIYTDLIDLNNNGVIDSLEDDFEPEYEYGIDREGYHLIVEYDLLDNLSLRLGWLNESEVSSRRKNDSRYLHITYQRDIPDFGTIIFQNRFVRVRDDIPDYTYTLRPLELNETQVSDELDFYNARVNTMTLQFLYTAIPNLTLEAKFLVILQKQLEQEQEGAIFLDVEHDEVTGDFEPDERVDFLVPIEQVRTTGGIREFPFYPDHGSNALNPDDTGLIYDSTNWKGRRYPERSIRRQQTILKARYEIPLGDLPFVDRIGEDLTLTPMVKYIWDRAFDRTAEEIPLVLNPRFFQPTDDEPIEYLRFNQRSREDVLGVRLDYQFTQRMNILGGFQYRKFTNRDNNFREYLGKFPADQEAPDLFRRDLRTRIFEIQAINRGDWIGFNIVILAGYRKTTVLLKNATSNTTFVRAMMGF